MKKWKKNSDKGLQRKTGKQGNREGVMFIKRSPLDACALGVMFLAGCQIISMLPQNHNHNQNLKPDDNNGEWSNGHNHDGKSANVSTINVVDSSKPTDDDGGAADGRSMDGVLDMNKDLKEIFAPNALNHMTTTHQIQHPDTSAPPTSSSISGSDTHLSTSTTLDALTMETTESEKLFLATTGMDDLIVAAKRPSKQYLLSDGKWQMDGKSETAEVEGEETKDSQQRPEKDNTPTIQLSRPNEADKSFQHQVYYQIDLQTSATATAAFTSSNAFYNAGEGSTRTSRVDDRDDGDRDEDSQLMDKMTTTKQELETGKLVSDATTSLSAPLMNIDDPKSTTASTSTTSTTVSTSSTPASEFYTRSDDHNNTDITARITTSATPTIIDMSAFLSLVSCDKIRILARRHYQNDPDVQSAYDYMQTPDFAMLRQHLFTLPEVRGLLQYFEKQGLDIIEFLTPIMETLWPFPFAEELVQSNVGGIVDHVEGSGALDEEKYTVNEDDDGAYLSHLNDIDYRPIDDLAQTDSLSKAGNRKLEIEEQDIYLRHRAHYPFEQKQQFQQERGREAATGPYSTSTTEYSSGTSKGGLLGLIEEALETLPQDIVLAVFFDKLETDEQFSQLIHSFSQPEFHQLINNFNNSPTLRHFVIILQSHRIPVMDILDLVRSYFFLGSF